MPSVPESRIDTTFDLRSDTPPGKDPDTFSHTLRRYHRLLWSKPLPNGAAFDLDISNRRRYLHHKSSLGEFFLASDTIIRTFRTTSRAQPVLSQIPESDREAFSRQGYTIGGTIIFPGDRRPGSQTVNQARGLNRRIEDRFDLTLECIRRHYLDQDSPLTAPLSIYRDFFDLFTNFRGYVDFFLLQDLVSDDSSHVRFFSQFHDFSTPAIPQTVDEYKAFRVLSLQFVAARNRRIAEFAAQLPPASAATRP